jgi:hypothetical protein
MLMWYRLHEVYDMFDLHAEKDRMDKIIRKFYIQDQLKEVLCFM